MITGCCCPYAGWRMFRGLVDLQVLRLRSLDVLGCCISVLGSKSMQLSSCQLTFRVWVQKGLGFRVLAVAGALCESAQAWVFFAIGLGSGGKLEGLHRTCGTLFWGLGFRV